MNSPPGNDLKDLNFTREDFDYLRRVVTETTGIVASEDKYSMYYSRLARRLRTLGLSDFRAYREYLKKNPESESIELVNSVTTNLTSFFRENHHFDFLRDRVIAPGCRQNRRRLRIWSAGCASGEEAYSIAITLAQSIPDLDHWDIRILACDIDSHVLATARSGIYDFNQIKNLEPMVRERYFRQLDDGKCGGFEIDPALKQMIEFRQLNLLHDWRLGEKFDLIFCRNVVIYFDRDTKAALVERFANQLNDGGYLLMGHSESLYKTSNRFELLGRTIYRLSKSRGERG